MAKRWHPGHYMHCSDGVARSGLADWKRVFVAANSNFKGYQVTIYWGQTESTLGDYSALYTQLDAIRAAAQADGKKIWLRMFERSFVGYSRPRPMPQYVSDNGWDFASSGSENIWAPKLWEDDCKAAFLDWCEAVAIYCAANPEFVMLSTEEYRIQGDYQQPGFTWAALHDLWQDVADRLLANAGDCPIQISAGWGESYPPDYNVDKPILDELVLGTRKVATGPTDLRKDNNSGSAFLSTNFGSFMTNAPDHPSRPGYRGIAVFCCNYEWSNYNSVEPPAEHLRWGVDDLGLHFIGWDPDVEASTGMAWNWSHALAAVNNAGGRINTARPANVSDTGEPPPPDDPVLPRPMLLNWFPKTVTSRLNWKTIGATATSAPVWSTPAAQTAYVGVAFSFTPTLASGYPASTFSKVSGPSWASVNSSTGEVTGTPSSAASVADVVVGANNGVGSTVNVTVPITVLAAPAAFSWVTGATLPNAVQGEPYYQVLQYLGAEPVTFTVTAGSLPAGLTRVGNTISGTPTTVGGPTSLTLEGDNAYGSPASRAFSITVGAPSALPVITTSSLPSATVGVSYSQTIAATGTGTITRAVVSGALPPGLSLAPTTGALTGTPTAAGGYGFTVRATNAYTDGVAPIEVTYYLVVASTSTPPVASPWAQFVRQ